jgi:hypothetical protein
VCWGGVAVRHGVLRTARCTFIFTLFSSTAVAVPPRSCTSLYSVHRLHTVNRTALRTLRLLWRVFHTL